MKNETLLFKLLNESLVFLMETEDVRKSLVMQ